jgi:signal transduction histidine kinase
MTPRSKILIVDDELSMRIKLENMLNEEGYEIMSVAKGSDLLTELPEFQADLILLDVLLPDVDGFELCRRVKSNSRFQHIPIILITALNGKKVLVQGLESGADDFLQKPVSKLELRARVRSMLRIKRQYDELEATLKIREELSNMIVHDMSSPIISVLLHTTLLEEAITEPESLNHLRMIRLAADRLDSFVNDMLVMAKMEQSKLRLNLTRVDVNQLASDAQQHFNIIAQSKNIRLIMELPKNPLEMSIDSNLFRRVIANLLANALQYSPNDTTVKLCLEKIEGSDNKPHLYMQVVDEGHGIPEEYRTRIFEKFEVVELKRKGVSQIGLGLTFCKMAVDAHGGKIFVESNRPKGSIFIVQI